MNTDPDDIYFNDLERDIRQRTMISDFDLGVLIYQRYYAEAKKIGIVWTLYDLAVRDGLFSGPDDAFSEDDIPDYAEHGQAIAHVMQMEIAHWVFRKLNGAWGEVVDGMIWNRNVFCNEYREKTGYQIDTKQDDLIY